MKLVYLAAPYHAPSVAIRSRPTDHTALCSLGRTQGRWRWLHWTFHDRHELPDLDSGFSPGELLKVNAEVAATRKDLLVTPPRLRSGRWR